MAEPIPMDDARREELVAFLDGEMDQAAAAQFEQRLRGDTALRAELDALKRTWELLDFLPQPEASATFTSKTLDKISVLRPAISGAVTMPASAPSMSVPVSRPRRPKWLVYLVWSAAALALLVIGYAASGPPFRKGTRPVDSRVAEEDMARDLRVLHQLPQYEVGEDIAFLRALDDPELFGDDSSGQ